MSDDLQSKMRQLVYRLVAMAPEAPPFPEELMVKIKSENASTSPTRRLRPNTVVALAAAVVLLGIAVPVFLMGGDNSPLVTEPTQTTQTSQTQSTSGGTVGYEYLGGGVYSYLDGEVTFRHGSRWDTSIFAFNFGPTKITLTLDGYATDKFMVMADPAAVGIGCEPGPAPADVAALAESIGSDPNLEVTAPVAVRIGGIDGLQMDVVAADGASATCGDVGAPLVVVGLSPIQDEQQGEHFWIADDGRMRLYLLDLPGGSARILAIAISAEEERFEQVMLAATPIVDSFEFHAG